ncbi:hypothetical protein [Cylindrospermopsis raciborskii]|nr:hypothetical protein [Cylindrospermopsis raciborskii]
MTQSTISEDRLDRIEQKLDHLSNTVDQLSSTVGKLSADNEKFNDRFSHYQQAT